MKNLVLILFIFTCLNCFSQVGEVSPRNRLKEGQIFDTVKAQIECYYPHNRIDKQIELIKGWMIYDKSNGMPTGVYLEIDKKTRVKYPNGQFAGHELNW